MIKYLGSKRLLVPHLVAVAQRLPGVHTVVDPMSGTARVGHALKAAGFYVRASDHNAYAAMLARCYVQVDARLWRDRASRLLAELATAPAVDGWFTQTWCREARFFQEKNGVRIEGIRAAIAARELEPELEAVALVALMEAADRVDSTVGVQMAYLKQWAPRANQDLALRLPAILDGPGESALAEAEDAVATGPCDLLYLDPPYNQHKYRNNYHIWETLVRWDQPGVYGVARKREDCRTFRSAFNTPRDIEAALAAVLDRAQARHLVISFSDEGFLERAALERILGLRGHVRVLSIDHPRYVGARIGIHNPRGERVGTVSHVRNTEYIYVVAPDRADLAGLDGIGH